MIFTFRQGTEYVRFRLQDNSMSICSKMTSDQFVSFTEALFKRDREKRAQIRHLEIVFPRLSQEQKEAYIIMSFNKWGYTLDDKRAE